jgi:hypothetical protein
VSDNDERTIDELGWSFMSGFDIGAEDDPYLDRLCIVRTPLFSVYLHHIHRRDTDPDPHDHPWWFTSLVLCGGYEEIIWPDKRQPERMLTRYRRRFSLASTDRDAAHMITSVEGELWTLVFAGPRRGEWGFWVNGQLAPWREYLS